MGVLFGTLTFQSGESPLARRRQRHEFAKGQRVAVQEKLPAEGNMVPGPNLAPQGTAHLPNLIFPQEGLKGLICSVVGPPAFPSEEAPWFRFPGWGYVCVKGRQAAWPPSFLLPASLLNSADGDS
uniref:Uncharacterized protein n=1 Tax=Micrurus corallinus TaxID=54390 RepID=A0A2D4FTI1_MICCO